MRKSRGVYYTPPPVVNFIVRAINHVLKHTLSIEQGLADRRRVTALDFATGTGTFLLEAFHQIFDSISLGVRSQVIREHMLKNSIWIRISYRTLHDSAFEAFTVPPRQRLHDAAGRAGASLLNQYGRAYKP